MLARRGDESRPLSEEELVGEARRLGWRFLFRYRELRLRWTDRALVLART